MTGRIRVTGFRRPRMTRPLRQFNRRVALIRPFNLLWLIPVFGVPALPDLLPNVLPNLLPDFLGPPHLLLFSTSTGQGPLKFYTDCAYVGLDGGMSHRSGSSCPAVSFFRDRRG